MRKLVFILLAAMVFVFSGCQRAAESTPTASPADLTGMWQGELKLLDQEIDLVVRFRGEGSDLTGSADIPSQGLRGLEVSSIEVNGSRVKFEIRGDLPTSTFEGEVQADRLAGDYRQSAFRGTFVLERVSDVIDAPVPTASPARSLAYLEEEVRIQNGDIILAGTLTLPKTGGPHPAVILLTGSGPQDRNNAHPGFPGYEPFLWLADHLSSNGIAVLRYDDRGMGETVGGESGVDTSADLATDVHAIVDFLQTRDEIRPDQIGLIGHSEGAFIAAIAAAENDEVAFVVSMAGHAVSGYDLMMLQAEVSMEIDGLSEEEGRRRVESNRKEMGLILAQDWEALEEYIYEETLIYYSQLPEDQRPAESEMDQVARDQVAQSMPILKGWLHFFVAEDPADYWREVQVPVLALFGETDYQVAPEQNLDPMQSALEAAGNEEVTILVLPGVNHLFQPAPAGGETDYLQLPMEFAPGVLDIITDWIAEQTDIQ